MTQEVEILNRTITNKVTELVKTTVKSPKQNPKTRWIYWWILLSVLRRIHINISYSSEKKMGILPTSFCETNILILKPNKKLTRKENDRAISLMNIDTNILSKILSKQIQEKVSKLNIGTFRKVKYHDQFGVIPGMLAYTLSYNKSKQKSEDISIMQKIIW